MEIKQLKYFVEVAKREHISEAALELNIAQSAVSRHIRQLEKELNTTLFYRRGRNVFLTSEGKRLLNDAERILEQVHFTVSQFQSHADTEHHTIRIGYSNGSVTQILPTILALIENTLEVTVIPNMIEDALILRALHEQSIDIALTTHSDSQSEYRNIALYEEAYAIYGHKDTPLLNIPNPPLKDLLKQTLYIYEPLPYDLKTYLHQHAIHPVYTINNPQFARFILQNQKGFVLAPTYLNLYSRNEQWKQVLLSHTDFKKSVYLIYRNELQKPLLEDVIHILTKHIQQHTTYH
ncbi:LysR family transcriptional regulator [Staphylococcus felis]|uniref:glutamate biosynthesis transcriptional regulator GltC n=1 Tax=Staphylococcus felis TaxID=46127 RepID=UPI000E28C9D4|nr:LysR family transcriptional regulator [Staphylococcus felis]REH89525.1 LysR family transcriptional regulator [Staphylococcus felis]